jgi:hypothetical protein
VDIAIVLAWEENVQFKKWIAGIFKARSS